MNDITEGTETPAVRVMRYLNGTNKKNAKNANGAVSGEYQNDKGSFILSKKELLKIDSEAPANMVRTGIRYNVKIFRNSGYGLGKYFRFMGMVLLRWLLYIIQLNMLIGAVMIKLIKSRFGFSLKLDTPNNSIRLNMIINVGNIGIVNINIRSKKF
jgi:hypothetical protein